MSHHILDQRLESVWIVWIFFLWNIAFKCFAAKTGYSWHLSGLCLFLQHIFVFKKEKTMGRTLGHTNQIQHYRSSKENSRVTVLLEKSFWVLYWSGIPGLPLCFPSSAQNFPAPISPNTPFISTTLLPLVQPYPAGGLPEVLRVSTSGLKLEEWWRSCRVLYRGNTVCGIQSKAWVIFLMYILLNLVIITTSNKVLWRKAWQPIPVYLPGELHEQRNLACCGPWGHKELGTTEWLSMIRYLFCYGTTMFHCNIKYNYDALCITWEGKCVTFSKRIWVLISKQEIHSWTYTMYPSF